MNIHFKGESKGGCKINKLPPDFTETLAFSVKKNIYVKCGYEYSF